ncbi:MAG: LPS assembly protein LptD [Verrucomicrobia bacterium]|nr:LPS assembly protein LptD [Verrucomicrobiota bacterium]
MSCIPRAMCPSPLMEDLIYVDLSNPIYSDGVLQTQQGGVIHTKDLRVQAQDILYINKDEQCTMFCQGNLLIDYKEWILTGESFFYDFASKTGYLIAGRTAAPPWYIGSKRMELRENGDVIVFGGYLTTSEGPRQDVRLLSPRIRLTKNRVVSAKDITLFLGKLPLAWVPALKVDLNNLEKTPFALQVGWGGFMAEYLTVLCHFLDWKDFKAIGRFDSFFQHGVGFGVDTRYTPQNTCREFYTRNYYVFDLPLSTPQTSNRWRYQGTYSDKIDHNKVSIKACYDVVSDGQMAAQYVIKDFDLKTAGRTQLEIRRQERDWIANLFTRVRVNDFQSVNQELPSFKFNWHPTEIGHTGIIATADLQAAYLHYMFSKFVSPSTNIEAGRLDLRPSLYRPFHYDWWTITPELGGIATYYTNSPIHQEAGQLQLLTGVKCEGSTYRCGECYKHILTPYLHYQFFATPNLSNDLHYIFTIQDGLGSMNRFRFGARNSLFFRKKACVQRPLWWDIWGNLFIKQDQAFPDQKMYLNAEYYPFQNISLTAFSAWDFQENLLDQINTRVNYTMNENFAISAEYRHRSRYAWRKADFYNFILENVRTKSQLLASPLSDQRDTFLLRTFLRFTPEISLNFDLRHGWRLTQPNYTEYLIELEGIVFEHWRCNAIYEHRESDTRYSIALRLDPGPPKMERVCPRF